MSSTAPAGTPTSSRRSRATSGPDPLTARGAAGTAARARRRGAPGRTAPGQTTAPSSQPESLGGPSPRRTTSATNPPMNAATAANRIQPCIGQRSRAASSREVGPPKSASQASLVPKSTLGSGGGGGGT